MLATAASSADAGKHRLRHLSGLENFSLRLKHK